LESERSGKEGTKEGKAREKKGRLKMDQEFLRLEALEVQNQ
jgi:hypothetical protein